MPDRYAGLVSRLAALAVDVAVLTVAVLAIGALPPAATEAVLGSSPDWLARACAIAGAVLPWLYFTLCWWLTGETVGGLLLGIRVRRRDGARVSPVRAGLRAFLGLTFAPLWLVGLLAILVDGRRRALHDLVFATVVRYADRSRAARER